MVGEDNPKLQPPFCAFPRLEDELDLQHGKVADLPWQQDWMTLHLQESVDTNAVTSLGRYYHYPTWVGRYQGSIQGSTVS